MLQKKNMTKTLNIESEIFFIIASSLTTAVFNLNIHLVKIPEAGEAVEPQMNTAPAPCV